jgi:hypothetical protein
MIASLSSPLAGLVGDARLAPRTGFATADLIEALGVFPCYFFDVRHLQPLLLAIKFSRQRVSTA